MSTGVSRELEQFVRAEIASGHFADRVAVIEHALRLFQRDREEAIEGIQAGLADVAAGRTQPLDAAFADLRNASKPIDGA